MTAARLRVGVVGAGWWATSNHLPILKGRDDVDLAAVCRLGADELAQVQEAFGFSYATQDYGRMLAETQLDALIVASPHRLHAVQAIKAAEQGIHVLIEKPLATSAAEARAVEAAVAKAGVHGLVPFGWSFQPFAEVARDWVAEGRIGTVRHVAAQMASPIGELLTGRTMPGTEREMFRPNATMWSDPVAGGYGWGQLVHLLGLLVYVTELRAESVSAITDATSDRCDLFNAMVIRGRSGESLSISGAATLPAGDRFQVDIRIFGTEGVLLLDVERERLELRRSDGRNEAFAIPPGGGSYQCVEPVHRFVELCRGASVENPASVAIARTGCEIVEAMHASARTQAVIRIEDLP